MYNLSRFPTYSTFSKFCVVHTDYMVSVGLPTSPFSKILLLSKLSVYIVPPTGAACIIYMSTIYTISWEFDTGWPSTSSCVYYYSVLCDPRNQRDVDEANIYTYPSRQSTHFLQEQRQHNGNSCWIIRVYVKARTPPTILDTPLRYSYFVWL